MLHAATESVPTSSKHDNSVPDSVPSSSVNSNQFDQYKVIRRNGRVMVICENLRHKQRQG